MESLRSGERRHINGSRKLRLRAEDRQGVTHRTSVHFGTPEPDRYELEEAVVSEIATHWVTQFQRALAEATVENRIGKTMRTYRERLPKYAESKMTKEEIAHDLGVKPGSIDPYRKRARELLKKPEGD
jgi:DNA-directed RNA polymerase specialized sigma24 family protein